MSREAVAAIIIAAFMIGLSLILASFALPAALFWPGMMTTGLATAAAAYVLWQVDRYGP